MTVSAQNIIYVNQNAIGNNDGTSWTDAYIGFQDALTNLSSGDTIWIAQGTYYPTEDELGNQAPSYNPTKVFHASNTDLYVYGGFTGNETSLSQRNPQTNVVLLSGDLGVLGDYNDNANSILKLYSIPNGLIDGVTISFSGGVLSAIEGNNLADFTFNDCLISHNENTGIVNGGAANIGQSVLSFTNCNFNHNTANEGGSMYLSNSNISIYNSVFHHNSSSTHSGNITFNGNTSVPIQIANCLFYNNHAGSIIGGALYFYNVASGCEIFNCSFVNNSAPVGGALGSNGVNIDIYNSILWSPNSSSEAEEYNGNQNIITVSNSTVNGGYTGGTNILTTYPNFVDTTTYDFTLQSTSPAIDQGDTTGISNLIPVIDLNGNSRYMGSSIDLGCYEYCSFVNNITTSLNGTTITATENSAGVTYQWLDCNNNNAIIPNETAQSFTANTNGNYACQITNGCTIDTTACVAVTSIGVGISENSINNQIAVYPNPTTSQITIDIEEKIKNILIIDITGKTVKNLVPTNNTIDVSNLIKGIYFLQVQTEKGIINSKFIKE